MLAGEVGENPGRIWNGIGPGRLVGGARDEERGGERTCPRDLDGEVQVNPGTAAGAGDQRLEAALKLKPVRGDAVSRQVREGRVEDLLDGGTGAVLERNATPARRDDQRVALNCRHGAACLRDSG